MTVNEISRLIRQLSPALVSSVRLFDIYKVKHPEGTEAFLYPRVQTPDRTLSDDEADELHNELCPNGVQGVKTKIGR